jgi:alpha-tubulin suppressor-like RCC1 family protein
MVFVPTQPNTVLVLPTYTDSKMLNFQTKYTYRSLTVYKKCLLGITTTAKLVELSQSEGVLTEKPLDQYANFQFESVSAGEKHVLLLKENSGEALSWGDDSHGQSTVPPALPILVQISACNNTSAALTATGDVVFWGEHSELLSLNKPRDTKFVLFSLHFELPKKVIVTGLTIENTLIRWGSDKDSIVILPLDSKVTTDIIQIVVDEYQTVILTESGEVFLWNNHRNEFESLPKVLTSVKSIAGERYLFFALTQSDDLYFFGNTSMWIYPQISWYLPSNAKHVGIEAGFRDAVAWSSDKKLVGWGENFSSMNLKRDKPTVKHISVGQAHTVTLYDDGTVSVDDYNQLENRIIDGLQDAVAWDEDHKFWMGQDDLDRAIAKLSPPSNLQNVRSVCAGENQSIAVLANGSVVTWGWNSHIFNFPSDLSNISSAHMGWNHVIFTRGDGTCYIWGLNDWGQLNWPHIPESVTQAAAGAHHSLVITASGKVIAWGRNDFGQSSVPHIEHSVIAIAAGTTHSLALTSLGTVVSWGDNRFGLCDIPPDLCDVVAIAAGDNFSLALTASGKIVGWPTIMRIRLGKD